jgi:hypothetical protein
MTTPTRVKGSGSSVTQLIQPTPLPVGVIRGQPGQTRPMLVPSLYLKEGQLEDIEIKEVVKNHSELIS